MNVVEQAQMLHEAAQRGAQGVHSRMYAECLRGILEFVQAHTEVEQPLREEEADNGHRESS